MKEGTKRAGIIFFAVVLSAVSAEAQSLSGMFSKYIANQKMVKTFMGAGETRVEIYNGEGVLVNNIRTAIQIYMKYPDSFKVVTINGTERYEMVQQGSLISQKLPGTNTILTQQSTEKTDLFKKYFGYMVEGQVNDQMVQKIDTVHDGYETYTRFRVKTPDAGETKIDNIDYYFNGNSLLAQSVVYAESKELVKSTMRYIEKDGIFVVTEFRTEMWSQGSKIVSVIKYDAININTAIADREFELK
jgi:hypothetical protein